MSPVARLMRLASVVLCLIAIASFGLFAISQTSTASAHQQRELSGEASASSTPTGQHESGLRRAIDDASNAISSPFSSAVSGYHSEWSQRIVKLLLVLVVYGFGLAFLARIIRVRV